MYNKEQQHWETEDNGHLFEEWLQQGDMALVRPQRGDILHGIIVQVSPTELLVDIGAKRDGYVPARDLERLAPEMRESLHEGQEVSVIVTRVYDDTGDIELSIAQALQEQDWVRAKQLLESGDLVECEITGYNRGGLTVRFGQIRGFVPLSHVTEVPRNLSPEARAEHMARLIGQTITLCVIEVDRARRRLILSQREAQHVLRERRKDELLATLREGDIITGRVRSFADFGIFVDLGGVDGLIHRSELAWEHIDNIQEAFKIGQEVEALVIKVDKKERKIGLSLKRLQPNPWEERIAKYKVGDIVDALITNVTDFGAFARLEEGVEGLIHISELGLASGQHPRDLVQPGDEVKVKILDINKERQRISLSMRQAPQWEVAEETPAEAEMPPTAEAASGSPEGDGRVLEPEEEGEPPNARDDTPVAGEDNGRHTEPSEEGG